MKLKVFIVSLACLLNLVPSTFGTPEIIAGKALAGAALAKGALVAKGALAAKGVLAAKGLLAAKAALLAKGAIHAKAALLKGVVVGAKNAALAVASSAANVGAAALEAKGAIIHGTADVGAKILRTGAVFANANRIAYVQPVPVEVPVPPVPLEERLSPVLGSLAGLFTIAKNSVAAKAGAVGEVVEALNTPKIISGSPVVYETRVVEPPPVYPVPMVYKLAARTNPVDVVLTAGDC